MYCLVAIGVLRNATVHLRRNYQELFQWSKPLWEVLEEGQLEDSAGNRKGLLLPHHTNDQGNNVFSFHTNIKVVSHEEWTELTELLDSPLARATVNDWTAFCGSYTTARELAVIERVFKLRDAQSITSSNIQEMISPLV